MTKKATQTPGFVTVPTTETNPENFTTHPYGKSKEFVFDVANEDDGRQALRDFCIYGGYNSGYSWGVLMRHNDILTVYFRFGQPCYGEICIYESDVGPGNLKNPSAKVNKPEDLYNPFPKGEPVCFAVTLDTKHDKEYIEHLFNPDHSPWKPVVQGGELIVHKGRYWGFLVNNMDIDPTWMVHLFKNIRNLSAQDQKTAMALMQKHGIPFWKAVLLALSYREGGIRVNSYSFSPTFNLDRFKNGEPVNLVEGGSIRERYSYNRPKMESIFVDDSSSNFYQGLATSWSSTPGDAKMFLERVLAA